MHTCISDGIYLLKIHLEIKCRLKLILILDHTYKFIFKCINNIEMQFCFKVNSLIFETMMAKKKKTKIRYQILNKSK